MRLHVLFIKRRKIILLSLFGIEERGETCRMNRPHRAIAPMLKSDFYSRLMMQLEGRDAKISDGIYDERMVQVRCSFSSEFPFCRNLLPYRLPPRVRRLSCVYQFHSG